MHQKTKATTDLNVCQRTETHAHFDIKILASFHANRWQLHSPNPPLKNQATSPKNENASTLRTLTPLPVGIEFQSDARELPDAPAHADNAQSNSALHTRQSTSQTARRKTRCSQHSLHVFVNLTNRRKPNTGKKSNVHRANDSVHVRVKLLTQTCRSVRSSSWCFFLSPSTSVAKDDLKRLITQTDATSLECCVGVRKRIRVTRPQALSTTPLHMLRCPLGPTMHLCNFSRVEKCKPQNFSHRTPQRTPQKQKRPHQTGKEDC